MDDHHERTSTPETTRPEKPEIKAETDDDLDNESTGVGERDSEAAKASAAIAQQHELALSERDVHGADRVAARDVDVDDVWERGDLYVQDDGQLVRVLEKGDGSFDIVVRDMSNPSGQPTTVIRDASATYIANKINSERWSNDI